MLFAITYCTVYKRGLWVKGRDFFVNKKMLVKLLKNTCEKNMICSSCTCRNLIGDTPV